MAGIPVARSSIPGLPQDPIRRTRTPKAPSHPQPPPPCQRRLRRPPQSPPPPLSRLMDPSLLPLPMHLLPPTRIHPPHCLPPRQTMCPWLQHQRPRSPRQRLILFPTMGSLKQQLRLRRRRRHLRSQRARPSANLSPPKPPAAAPTASSAPAERLASADSSDMPSQAAPSSAAAAPAQQVPAPITTEAQIGSEQTELSGTGAPSVAEAFGSFFGNLFGRDATSEVSAPTTAGDTSAAAEKARAIKLTSTDGSIGINSIDAACGGAHSSVSFHAAVCCRCVERRRRAFNE